MSHRLMFSCDVCGSEAEGKPASHNPDGLPVAERTEQLNVLSFEGARKLHIADPTDEKRPLCGRDGEPINYAPLEAFNADQLCKGCLEEVAALVTVKLPDPETGEVTERLVRRFHFRSDAEVLPLPEDFKAKVLAGDRPGLRWTGYEEPPVEIGQLIPLTSGVELTITGLSRTRKGDHVAHYTVDDDRPALPRRTPPIHEPPEFDHLGFKVEPTAEAIAAAGIDSSYTQDPKQAVSGVAPEVDVEYRRVLGVRRRMKQSEQDRAEDPMKEAELDAERLNRELKQLAKRAVKMGVDPVATVAPIQRAIEEAHANLSEQGAAA